ncbi:MAG TPA: hypothetical protein VMZ49_05965 [Patescibacteria group bacterium]|nr:hypothetical protein [Patescibacteria group bacterium]
MLDKKFPNEMLDGLNLRDRRVFDMYRVDEFLAKHLGGRAEPWQEIKGTSAEVR